MNTIHNRPEEMVTEMIDGYTAACPALLERMEGTKSVLVKNVRDWVTILAGGGAGCEPLYLGCAGIGMADAVVTGDVFAAPAATQLLRAMQYMYHEKGVLMITGNYVGDVLNYELAVELCGYEGIRADAVFVRDDILHKPKEMADRRRGIGGILPVIKVAAGAAEEGLSLEEVGRVARRAVEAVGTVSVTFWPGYRPETGQPMYEMPAGEIAFGMGFNGKPGVLRTAMPSADQLSKRLLDYLEEDMGLQAGEEIALILSGKGATSPMELYILSNSLRRDLASRHIRVFKTEVGNFMTAPGMGGVSLTILRLDEEIRHFYHKDSYTPMYTYCAGAQGGNHGEDGA